MPFVTFPNLYNLMFFSVEQKLLVLTTGALLWASDMKKVCQWSTSATRMTAILIAKSDVGVEELSQKWTGEKAGNSPWLNPCSILGTYAH